MKDFKFLTVKINVRNKLTKRYVKIIYKIFIQGTTYLIYLETRIK